MVLKVDMTLKVSTFKRFLMVLTSIHPSLKVSLIVQVRAHSVGKVGHVQLYLQGFSWACKDFPIAS